MIVFGRMGRQMIKAMKGMKAKLEVPNEAPIDFRECVCVCVN